MLGILLIDKPSGITSHDVIHRLRRRLGTRRVGHAGTLDPLGTGLLVVAVGPATRFLQYLPLEPKVYECVFRFGLETNTQDADGEVVAATEPPPDLAARAEAESERFLGLISQIPPMFSALKREGRPLYALARQGLEVDRPPRTVHIAELKFLGWEGPDALVRVSCSGGTYMRTLAHDMGRAVGCGAHLAALRRTAAGRFRIEDAAPLEEAGPDRLIPLRSALPPMPLVDLDSVQAAAIRQGRAVTVGAAPESELAGLVGPTGEVLGVARVTGPMLQPECVLPAEAAP